MDIDKIKKYLSSNLSKNRYEHSLRVADVSVELARLYGENELDAYLGGLLHDIAKEFDDEDIRKWFPKTGLDNNYLENKKIIHAFIGAEVARELYHVNDNVYTSIKYHNLGDKRMNTLDKIVFIADKIEPSRDSKDIETLRELAYRDLDKAIVLYIELRKSNGKVLHYKTKELLEYLK